MQWRLHSSFARSAVAVSASVWFALAFFVSSVAAQQEPDGLTIALNEWEDSGVSGWATLSPAEDGVRVEMAVEGTAVTGDHPTHIHIGTCDDPDPNPLYPLSTVILDPLSADGTSSSTVDDVTLDELLADDYVILVHPSEAKLTPYLVCGDISRDNEISAPASGSAGTLTTPSAGAGAALLSRGTSELLAALAVGAVVLVGGWLLRRQSIASQ